MNSPFHLNQHPETSFLLNVEEHSSTKKEIINIVEKLDIKVIDFHEYLIKEIDPKSFFPLGKHGHYNDTGYKALSNLISKYLNYVPIVNKIVDKIITIVTIDKFKTDELIKKGF